MELKRYKIADNKLEKNSIKLEQTDKKLEKEHKKFKIETNEKYFIVMDHFTDLKEILFQ